MTLFQSPMAAEIWLAFVIAAALILDFVLPHEKKSWFSRLAFFSMIPVLVIAALPVARPGAYFSGMYLVDAFAYFFKGFFALTAMFVVLMTREFERNLERGIPELYLLILTATFGMCALASAGDFLMLFIALEIITLSFYVMTTYLRHDLKSIEAGMKYLILGSIATGFLLYGISFLYGATGSTNFASIRMGIAQQPMLSPLLVFGFLLVIAGLAFKVAAVPFHFWVPDVYEGAPTP
ncbi:MAG: proton-translocating NADH-quinone oxidoreductase subunit N, partial [Candidatus Omnitrophica bacterium]|nr:proton-translocating NADH-quinone oxidoreductase subunit N [Candidatus Omnitrophota bacterium]